MIVDFCRFLLALLTSRRKNRRSEGFCLLTLQPQVSQLRWRLVWYNDRGQILSLITLMLIELCVKKRMWKCAKLKGRLFRISLFWSE